MSFNEIKRRLCEAPRLAHPYLKQPIVIYIDASNIAVGAVGLQRDNSGVERAISFFSTNCRRRRETIPRSSENVLQLYVHSRIFEYICSVSFLSAN